MQRCVAVQRSALAWQSVALRFGFSRSKSVLWNGISIGNAGSMRMSARINDGAKVFVIDGVRVVSAIAIVWDAPAVVTAQE